jgi:hypothetical protein
VWDGVETRDSLNWTVISTTRSNSGPLLTSQAQGLFGIYRPTPHSRRPSRAAGSLERRPSEPRGAREARCLPDQVKVMSTPPVLAKLCPPPFHSGTDAVQSGHERLFGSWRYVLTLSIRIRHQPAQWSDHKARKSKTTQFPPRSLPSLRLYSVSDFKNVTCLLS